MSKRKSRREPRRKRKRMGPPVVHVPAGTLTTQPGALASTVRIIAYGPEGSEELDELVPETLARLRAKWPVTWVHVVGVGDAAIIQRIGSQFGLHALALEDVVHTHQRPKVQRFGDITQIVIRIVEGSGTSETEQLSVFIGPGFVVSFEERSEDIFEIVRRRLRERVGQLCERGADFLMYTLLDVAIDAFFPVLEKAGDDLDEIEDSISESPHPGINQRLRAVKRELFGLRRALWPMREVLGTLANEPWPAIGEDTRVYLHDCEDHCGQLVDNVMSNRELATDLVGLEQAVASQRLNEVMKVLTVMSTLFIPLTFISSVYGMNFDPRASPLNMPELQWYWGYPFALTLMAASAGSLLFFFRRKGWL